MIVIRGSGSVVTISNTSHSSRTNGATPFHSRRSTSAGVYSLIEDLQNTLGTPWLLRQLDRSRLSGLAVWHHLQLPALWKRQSPRPSAAGSASRSRPADASSTATGVIARAVSPEAEKANASTHVRVDQVRAAATAPHDAADNGSLHGLMRIIHRPPAARKRQSAVLDHTKWAEIIDLLLKLPTAKSWS